MSDEFRRDAVVTIQGGAIYGLNLLGQLATLVYEHKIVPVGIAGNSAGAIIAVLYWAGLTPREIRTKIELLINADKKLGLARILGPSGPDEGQHSEWRLKKLISRTLPAHFSEAYPYDRFLQLFAQFDRVRRFRLGKGLPPAFITLAGLFFVLGLSAPLLYPFGLMGETWYHRSVALMWGMFAALLLGSYWLLYCFGGYNIYWFLKVLGAFSGERLEKLIDLWIREQLEKTLAREISSGSVKLPAPHEYLTFGNISVFMDIAAAEFIHATDKSKPPFYVPPLFLTATNLTTGKLEVINSFDEEYQGIRIASAVRASAGFPLVFRPIELDLKSGRCKFVDGGLVSNFPSWALAGDFRKRMDGNKRYKIIASLPWVNVGLRVGDYPDLSEVQGGQPQEAPDLETIFGYLKRLFQFMTSLTRDELEGRLDASVPRPVTVRQHKSEKTTASPKDDEKWKLHKISADKAVNMYVKGSEIADTQLKGLSFQLPIGETKARLEAILGECILSAHRILGEMDNSKTCFRANIFISSKSDDLQLCYHANMDHDDDKNAVFRFKSGHTGRCFVRRRPSIGNIKEVLRMRNSKDPNLFNFYDTTYETYQNTKPELSWLLSMPIFDPKEMYQLDEFEDPDDEGKTYFCTARKVLDGSILGVLNLDACFDYDDFKISKIPKEQLTDTRIQAIIHLMQSASFEVSRILSGSFGVFRP